jgi:malonate-semialdehyde dehydrogenase (acetylating)/methylmalonate-semialdehyde dehydrogenase
MRAGHDGTVKNYIGGAWHTSTSTEHLLLSNPATGEPLGSVPRGTGKDVDQAVAAAKAAFPAWRDTPPATRARYLFDLRNAMEEHFDELCALCTEEHGKTLDESRGDVRRGIDNVETAAGIPSLMMGDALEQIASGIDCVSVRQPMGVFAVIAPYNFPSMVPLWFLPYAIATGNTLVVKPSEQVPFSQRRIFELIDTIRLPKGVVNSVNGGKDVVNAILEHEDIAGVSFVGSSAVARHVYERAGATGKRAQALGGAKNFAVVMDDCDWEKSIANVVDSAFGCAGQRCLATSVVVGVGSAYARLRESLVFASRKVKVGNGRDPGVTMGPLISARHKERVLGYIDRGRKEGAELLLDGRGLEVADDLRQRVTQHGHRERRDLWTRSLRARSEDARRRDRPRQEPPARKRGLYLHAERRARPQVLERDRRIDGRRECRRRGPDELLHLRRKQGELLRRP